MRSIFNNSGKLFAKVAMCAIVGSVFFAPDNASAQTSDPFGFEDGTTDNWVGYSGSETVTVNSNATYVRTGLHSLKMNTTSSSSNKRWYTTTPYDTAYNGTTVFFIYWAKTDVAGTVADATLGHATSLPLSGNPSTDQAAYSLTLSTTGWTRLTNAVTYTSNSAHYIMPYPYKISGGATQSIYMDDGVLYSSNTLTTVDTTKPGTPSAVTGTVSGGNLIALRWVTNVDNPNGTGVQATIILRNANTSAAAPVLNDQALYSTTGGAAGPDSVSGGWQIISVTGGATDSTYLDPAPGNAAYKYAVVLRDMAYNYSLAAMSSVLTTTAPIPVVFVDTSAFNGNFGSVPIGSVSAESHYTVSAYNLTSDLSITAPAGFQVSLTTGTGFTTPVTITPVNGNVTTTPIFVHYAPTVPNGGTGVLSIVNTSTGANTLNVHVNGNAVDSAPTAAANISIGNVTDKTVAVNIPTAGNGNNRIIVIEQGAPVTYVPVNGMAATGVSSDYSVATDQGGGNKVVYDGAGSGNDVVTVTNLHPNTLYYFAVYEYNKGASATSAAYLPVSPNTALVKTDTFNLSIGNIATIADVTVFPNPAHGDVHVRSSVPVNVMLYDVAGRVVFNRRETSSVSISGLATGQYLLTVTDNDGAVVKKEKVTVMR